jgi:hypothetical protein
MIRGNFVGLLGKQLSGADLQALETVLFAISYPIVNLRYWSWKNCPEMDFFSLLITITLFLTLLFFISIIICIRRLLKDLFS